LAEDYDDEKLYKFSEYIEEFAEWEKNTKRPKKTIKVWNQGRVPACTRFALTHITNGQNINEYNAQDLEYDQINPITIRENGNKNRYLKAAINEARKNWIIEWFVWVEKTVEEMRKALSMWIYIYTWSANWWRGKYKSPYEYVVRTDGKRVWHAWPIVDDDPQNKRFVVLNSFGEKRWDGGYFYLPYDELKSAYNLYWIIDKDDTWKFQVFKQKQQVKAFLESAKSIYKDAPAEVQRLFENRKLSKNLEWIYWL
jgi:hypothetical protein